MQSQCIPGQAIPALGLLLGIFCSWLVEYISNDVPGKTMGFDEELHANLFGRTFGPRYLENFQKSLAWLRYRLVLSVVVNARCWHPTHVP